MIITIDGPAGAGKSTVAKLVAEQLGFEYLDTGAMYRGATWAALQQGTDLSDTQAVANLASEMSLQFSGGKVIVNEQDVTDAIRGEQVTTNVSHVADNPLVRAHLVKWQQQIASTGNYVCEGRDQGTVAFPDADCKIFLTASNEERARRRYEQLVLKGEQVEYESILQQQNERDQRDQSRPVGKLIKADDAVEVNTDGLSLDEVVERITEIFRARTN